VITQHTEQIKWENPPNCDYNANNTKFI